MEVEIVTRSLWAYSSSVLVADPIFFSSSAIAFGVNALDTIKNVLPSKFKNPNLPPIQNAGVSDCKGQLQTIIIIY